MPVNKVVYGEETLIDLTEDTVAADKLLSGYTAHAADGTPITGTAEVLDTSDADAAAEDIVSPKTAYVNGEKVTGSLAAEAIDMTVGSFYVGMDSGNNVYFKLFNSGDYGKRRLVDKGQNIILRSPAENLGDATAEDVAAGKTFTSSAGLKVTGTHTCATGGGLTMKTGTTTSGTIETGLSSLKCIVIYKDSVSATGLVQAVWLADDGSANYVYCSSYSSYYKNYAVGTDTSSTVSGGAFTWGGSGTSGLSSGTTYNWIAFGEA